ncbi:MAG: hypothetical protein GXY11_07950 [Clostridiales bacterium]|nr:hypothetical protein [Clostridiales bacterium]
MKKRRVISLLIAALLIVVFGAATGGAKAAGVVRVTVTATPSQLSEAGAVELRISIENGTDSTMEHVSVFGKGVTGFTAPIAAGETENVYIKDYWVAENMIGKPITVTVSYTLNGKTQKSFGSVTVSRLEIAPDVALERTSDVSVQEIGKPVVFTYTVYNKGVNRVADVIVRDTFTDEALNAPFSLSPGDRRQVQHTFSMRQDMASRPSVSFVSNGKKYVNTIDVLYVTTPEASLAVEVSASKTEVKPDEEITVTCKVTNKIGQTIRDVSVADETGQSLGDSFDLGAMQTKTITKSVKLTADRAFAVSAIGYVDGSKFEASSGTVNMRLLKTEPQPDMLKMKAEPSLTQLEEAGTVTFSITVSNLMEDTLTDVVISEKTLGEIATFDSLVTGDKLVTKDYEVTADQVFAFTVTALDSSGNRYEVDSGDIEILVGPRGSVTPTIPADAAAAGGLGTFLTIVLIIVGLIVVAGAVLIVLLVQERKAKKLAAAAPPPAPESTAPLPDVTPETVVEEDEDEDASFIPPEIEEAPPEEEAPMEEETPSESPQDAETEPEPGGEEKKGIDDIENPVD